MAPVFCETEAGAELQAEAFPVLLRLPSVENPADIPPGIIGIPGRDDDLSNVCCKKGRQVGPKVNPVMAIRVVRNWVNSHIQMPFAQMSNKRRISHKLGCEIKQEILSAKL